MLRVRGHTLTLTLPYCKQESLQLCVHALSALGPLCREAAPLDWLTLGRVALRCRQLGEERARLGGPLAAQHTARLRGLAARVLSHLTLTLSLTLILILPLP